MELFSTTGVKLKSVDTVYVAIWPKCGECGRPNPEASPTCLDCEAPQAPLKRDRKGHSLGLVGFTSSDPWEHWGWQLGHKLKRLKESVQWRTNLLLTTLSIRQS